MKYGGYLRSEVGSTQHVRKATNGIGINGIETHLWICTLKKLGCQGVGASGAAQRGEDVREELGALCRIKSQSGLGFLG